MVITGCESREIIAYPKTTNNKYAINNLQLARENQLAIGNLQLARVASIRAFLKFANYCLLSYCQLSIAVGYLQLALFPLFVRFFWVDGMALIQIHLTLMINLLTPVKNCFINYFTRVLLSYRFLQNIVTVLTE
jgi:hypothetical protein